VCSTIGTRLYLFGAAYAPDTYTSPIFVHRGIGNLYDELCIYPAGSENESSLDNFFTSSRSTQQQQRFESQAGSDPESEVNVPKKNKTSSDAAVDEKPKKCM
jgi:hypothetical protein